MYRTLKKISNPSLAFWAEGFSCYVIAVFVDIAAKKMESDLNWSAIFIFEICKVLLRERLDPRHGLAGTECLN